MNFTIKLQKEDRIWNCDVVNDTVITVWGKIGGKVQRNTSQILEGKNIGRSNETTPAQQAMVEARSKINKKIMEGYEVTECSDKSFLLKQKPVSVPAPMLAKDFAERSHKLNDGQAVYYQHKLDGIRCIANAKTGELYSRKLERMVIPHISDTVLAIAQFLDPAVEWLDGELYNPGMSFQEIASIVRSHKNTHKDIDTIQYHVYDLINDQICKDRMDILDALREAVADSPTIQVVETLVGYVKIASDVHNLFVKKGYEGAMMRDPDSLYKIGKRSDGLLKIKEFKQEEYEVIGLNSEKYEDTLGTFTLITKEGNQFEARPAFTDEERQNLWNDKDNVDWSKFVATVKFFELTDDGIPRFPVCLGIRHEDDR